LHFIAKQMHQSHLRADWYFDYVSPFSYLQAERLSTLHADIELFCKPVLFAGLLDHWEHKGPAEIGGKRRFTYRHVLWLAQAHGIAIRFPPSHPFNPLKLLRLTIALGCDRDSVMKIFRFVWRDGLLPDSGENLRKLAASLNLNDAEELDALASTAEAKDALRRNGEDAIACGVFGVPTIVIGGELFWGFDATDMAIGYLQGAHLFADGEMQRVSDMPYGAVRKSPGKKA
jgi:2-hydroxychromene-2-carboxylate isomerase